MEQTLHVVLEERMHLIRLTRIKSLWCYMCFLGNVPTKEAIKTKTLLAMFNANMRLTPKNSISLSLSKKRRECEMHSR